MKVQWILNTSFTYLSEDKLFGMFGHKDTHLNVEGIFACLLGILETEYLCSH